MITEIRIENFKSIVDLTLKPGRVTVLIGENGSGKSNILEAIAFGAGAAGNKLDREFLFSRGVRVAESEWMRSAFVETSDVHLAFACETKDALGFDWNISPVMRSDGSFDRWLIRVATDWVDIKKHYATDEAGRLVFRQPYLFSRLGDTRFDRHNVRPVWRTRYPARPAVARARTRFLEGAGGLGFVFVEDTVDAELLLDGLTSGQVVEFT